MAAGIRLGDISISHSLSTIRLIYDAFIYVSEKQKEGYASSKEMSTQESSIHELLEAEKEADALIQRAAKEKERKVADAREKTIAAHAEGKKKIDQEMDAYVAEQLKKIGQKKKIVLERTTKEAEQLEKKARTSLQKASHILLKEFGVEH